MEQVKPKYIQNTLRKQRMILGYSQKSVSLLLGHVNSSRVSQWEKGECLPNVENLFNLSILYGIHAHELFSDHIQTLTANLDEKRRTLFPEMTTF
jgi:transcriptional regulator with XRE-family HTH domain